MAPDGTLLRAYRFNAGLTQAELALRAGLTEKYISELERGVKRGGARGWKRIADALGINVLDLTQGEKAG